MDENPHEYLQTTVHPSWPVPGLFRRPRWMPSILYEAELAVGQLVPVMFDMTMEECRLLMAQWTAGRSKKQGAVVFLRPWNRPLSNGTVRGWVAELLGLGIREDRFSAVCKVLCTATAPLRPAWMEKSQSEGTVGSELVRGEAPWVQRSSRTLPRRLALAVGTQILRRRKQSAPGVIGGRDPSRHLGGGFPTRAFSGGARMRVGCASVGYSGAMMQTKAVCEWSLTARPIARLASPFLATGDTADSMAPEAREAFFGFREPFELVQSVIRSVPLFKFPASLPHSPGMALAALLTEVTGLNSGTEWRMHCGHSTGVCCTDVLPGRSTGCREQVMHPHGGPLSLLKVRHVSRGLVKPLECDTDFTWFPGYAWSAMYCSECVRLVHIGWRYYDLAAAALCRLSTTKPGRRVFGRSRPSKEQLAYSNELFDTARSGDVFGMTRFTRNVSSMLESALKRSHSPCLCPLDLDYLSATLKEMTIQAVHHRDEWRVENGSLCEWVVSLLRKVVDTNHVVQFDGLSLECVHESPVMGLEPTSDPLWRQGHEEAAHLEAQADVYRQTSLVSIKSSAIASTRAGQARAMLDRLGTPPIEPPVPFTMSCSPRWWALRDNEWAIETVRRNFCRAGVGRSARQPAFRWFADRVGLYTTGRTKLYEAAEPTRTPALMWQILVCMSGMHPCVSSRGTSWVRMLGALLSLRDLFVAGGPHERLVEDFSTWMFPMNHGEWLAYVMNGR
jgi:hypothetical protein